MNRRRPSRVTNERDGAHHGDAGPGPGFLASALRSVVHWLLPERLRAHKLARDERVVTIPVGTSEGLHVFESARAIPVPGVEKLGYFSHKLGRRWCSYTRNGEQPSELNRLRLDWAKLVTEGGRLPRWQRAEVLRALNLGMAFGDPRGDLEKRRYLQRQLLYHTDRYAGIDSIPLLLRNSPTAFFRYAVEELAGWPAEERDQIRAAIAQRVPHEGDDAAFLEMLAAAVFSSLDRPKP